MFTNIHHVGYLVENMDAAVAAYEQIFGGKVLSRQHYPALGQTNAFVQSGDTMVELMEPDDKSRMGGAKGQVLHHVAYQVDNIEEAVKVLESKGVKILDKTPRVNAHGWKLVYFDGGEILGAGLHVIQA